MAENCKYTERELKRILEIVDSMMVLVPKRYRWATLKTLVYDPKVKNLTPERYESIIHSLQAEAYPGAGIAWYGAPSTGKTTMMAAVLHKIAVDEAQRRLYGSGTLTPVWLDMGSWVLQQRSYNFGGSKPRFSTQDMQRFVSGATPVLFLDEFDKVGDDPRNHDILNAFMRAAYDKKAVIFLTTNLTREEFHQKFDKHITRRTGEDGDGIHINLFKEQ